MKIVKEKLYSVKELALFCLSESTWRRRIKAREIAYLKIGGTYLIRGADLAAYMEGCLVPPVKQKGEV